MCCSLVIYPVSLTTEQIVGTRIWIYSNSCFCLLVKFRVISFLCLVAFCIYVMFIWTLYKFGSWVIYFEQRFGVLWTSLVLLQLFGSSLVRHIRLESFFVYFAVYVFPHSSCSVVVSFFFFYVHSRVYNFAIFSYRVSISTFGWNKFFWFWGSEISLIKSVCDIIDGCSIFVAFSTISERGRLHFLWWWTPLFSK